jgi:hypothetical protein
LGVQAPRGFESYSLRQFSVLGRNDHRGMDQILNFRTKSVATSMYPFAGDRISGGHFLIQA